jgi:pyrroline-5-carboxylate reductase
MSAPTLGIIGAGAITAAIVAGLRRDGSGTPPTVLSPRGEGTARRRLTEAGWLDAVTEALDGLIAREDLRSENR